MAEESLGHGVVGGVPHTREVRYSTFSHLLKWILAIDIAVTLGIVIAFIDGAKGHKWIAALVIAVVLIPLLYSLYAKSTSLDERRHEEQ